MRDRLIELRKSLGLTQTAFAKGLSLSPSNISNWERGSYEPANSVITLICKTYGCSEEWLRTGEGEMFPPRSWKEDVALYVGRILADEDADVQAHFIELMQVIPPSVWRDLAAKAREILEREAEK